MTLASLLRGNDRGAITLRLALSAALVAVSAAAGTLGIGSAASAAAGEMVYVCKYVGPPSGPYSLSSGQNPIHTAKSSSDGQDAHNDAHPSFVVGSADPDECLPDLTMDKAAPASVNVGGTGSYVLTVGNDNVATAEVVTVQDALPAGVVATGAASGTGWSCTAQGVTPISCSRSGVGANGAPSITVPVQFTSVGTQIANTATVQAAHDLDTGNNSDTAYTDVLALLPDVAVSKTGDQTVQVGDTGVAYSISVSNAGAGATDAISLTDTFPTGATATAASGAGWTCGAATTSVTCTHAAIAGGGSADPLQITLSYASASVGTSNNTAQVPQQTGEPATALANNISALAVAVDAANTPPVAADDTHSTAGGGVAQTVNVLGNDDDPDGDPLTVTAVNTTGTLGSVTIAGDGKSVSYTPPAVVATATTTTFTYTISDGRNGTHSATVTVSLAVNLAGNNAPVARNDTSTTPFGTPVVVNVLANDTDADGNPLTVTSSTAPANGSVTWVGGVVTYTPNAGFNGNDSFTYTVSDGQGGSDTATVSVTVLPEVVIIPGNRAPVAVDDSVSTGFGRAVVIKVLANDSDPDGDPLSIVRVVPPGKGAIAVQAARQGGGALRVSGSLSLPTTAALVYTPAAGSSGQDTFTYVISDGRGGEDEATVTVAVDSAPVVTPTEEPTEEPSPIGGVTSPEPATGGSPTPTQPAAGGGSSPSPIPSQLPFVDDEEQEPAAQPQALPFTGSGTDLLLGLGAGLSVIGLMLALAGRRHRTVE